MSMNKSGAGLKESFRKLLVALKRRPHIIALLVFAVAFLVYSLNLMNISDTTAKVQGKGMGLCGFATMLFSLLSLLCFLNAFPHRKKVNVPMLVLAFLMVGILLFADTFYISAVDAARFREVSPIEIGPTTQYIADAYSMLITHRIVLVAGVVLTALLPVYGKLLRRINTSVAVEDNGKLDAIEISGED